MALAWCDSLVATIGIRFWAVGTGASLPVLSHPRTNHKFQAPFLARKRDYMSLIQEIKTGKDPFTDNFRVFLFNCRFFLLE